MQTQQQAFNDEAALLLHNGGRRSNAECFLKTVDKRVEDVIDDPLTDITDTVPDALKQAFHGKLAVLVGNVVPPIDHSSPCVLNQTPQKCGKATQHRAQAVKEGRCDAGPVNPSNERCNVVAQFPPIHIFDCGTQCIQSADDTVRERLCSLLPVNSIPQAHETVGKCFAQRGPVDCRKQTAQPFNESNELPAQHNAEVGPIYAVDDTVNHLAEAYAQIVPIECEDRSCQKFQSAIQPIGNVAAHTRPINACDHVIELFGQHSCRRAPLTGLQMIHHGFNPIRQGYIRGFCFRGTAAASAATIRAVVTQDVQFIKRCKLSLQLVSFFRCSTTRISNGLCGTLTDKA